MMDSAFPLRFITLAMLGAIGLCGLLLLAYPWTVNGFQAFGCLLLYLLADVCGAAILAWLSGPGIVWD